MKYAKFTRHQFITGRRKMYSIWMRLWQDDKTQPKGYYEYFNGPITEYRAHGWEWHTTCLIMDSMKMALMLAGHKIVGGL